MKLITILTSVMLLGCASLFLTKPTRSVTSFEDRGPKVTNFAGPGHPALVELRDVDAETVSIASRKLRDHFDHGDKMLYLRINSNGGAVFAGLDFIQNVEEMKKRGAKLTCVVDTRAISMGFVILQAACDVRLATPRAFFLAHNGHLTTEGGTVDDMKESVALLEQINEAMAVLCSEKIGMTLEAYKFKLHDKKSWILGAQEAVDENVVDRLISPMEVPLLDESF